MEDKMILAKKWIYKVLLCGIILIQVLYTTYVFVAEKKGYNADEVWSFGMSNSYFHAFYTFDKDIPSLEFAYDREQLENNEQWISGEILKDYITVQHDQRFAYDSVCDNNAHDVHPPLYHMLLHTICSFFPDTFSWWYGFGLNLLFLIGTQFFLFMTVKKVSENDAVALAACLLYAGSEGAVCTFTFIRQYTLLTMLCTGFAYFSACLYDEAERKQTRKKTVVMASVCALLAFLTHYYAILYIGVFTALLCICLLLKRNWKSMLMYGCSILLALGLFFCIYPAAMKHFFQYNNVNRALSFSPPIQIRILLSDLFRYNYGFTIGYFPTAFWNITLPLLGAIIVMTAGLLFPFRHEIWLEQLKLKVRKAGGQLFCVLKCANYIPFIAVLSSLAVFEVVSHTVDVYIMGRFSMRYVSMTLPVICMGVIIGLAALLSKNKTIERYGLVALYTFVIVVIFRVHITAQYPYVYPVYGDDGSLAQMTEGKNVILIDGHWYDYVRTATFFTPDLYEAEKVCFTSRETMEECFRTLELEKEKVDYLIIESQLFALTKEEEELVHSWMPEGMVIMHNETMYGDEATQKYASEIRDRCMEYVEKINNGDPYEIISLRVGQRGAYFVLKY